MSRDDTSRRSATARDSESGARPARTRKRRAGSPVSFIGLVRAFASTKAGRLEPATPAAPDHPQHPESRRKRNDLLRNFLKRSDSNLKRVRDAFKLSDSETKILLYLLNNTILNSETLEVRDILALVAESDEEVLDHLAAFRPETSKLIEHALIEFQYDGDSVFDRAVAIADNALRVLVEPAVLARPEIVKRLKKAAEAEDAIPVSAATAPRTLPTPRQIYDRLSATVCFQEEAKRVLAVQGYQHLLRASASGADATALAGIRNHVLLVGPTGTGKTLLAESLAKILEVPFYAADATTMTAEGYIGTHLWEVFYHLYKRSGRDIAKAETGVLFIDEIDKTATHSGADFYIATTAVQEALLTVLQGGSISFPESGSWREHNHVDMKTDRILFILGGAFRSLPETIAKRSAAAGGKIGFFSKADAARIGALRNSDLVELGMIPELVGRIGAKVQLEPLTADSLKHILLTSDRSILRRYEAWFAQQKRKFSWTADAVEEIARAALLLEVGARGLETVMELVLRDDLYDLEGKRPVKLTGKLVRERTAR